MLTIAASVTHLYGTAFAAEIDARGTFTGYAMGRQHGGVGSEIRQGSAANHYVGYGCDDPAESWPFGAWIYTRHIDMHASDGSTFQLGDFSLDDSGDPDCAMGDYWVDIYFGRYKLSNQSCTCSGSPSSGAYCINASVNSCTDAGNFGTNRNWGYSVLW
jgi:hypothetical protein